MNNEWFQVYSRDCGQGSLPPSSHPPPTPTHAPTHPQHPNTPTHNPRPPSPPPSLTHPAVTPQHVRNVHARWDMGTGSQVVHVSCFVQNVALACVRPCVPSLRSTRRSRYDAGGKDALTLFFSAFEKMRATIPPSTATRMGRTVTSTVSTTFLPSISSTISCWWCPVFVCSFLTAALLGILMEMILAVDSAETRLLGNTMPTVFFGAVIILSLHWFICSRSS